MDNFWIGFICGASALGGIIALINLATLDWCWKQIEKEFTHEKQP